MSTNTLVKVLTETRHGMRVQNVKNLHAVGPAVSGATHTLCLATKDLNVLAFRVRPAKPEEDPKVKNVAPEGPAKNLSKGTFPADYPMCYAKSIAILPANPNDEYGIPFTNYKTGNHLRVLRLIATNAEGGLSVENWEWALVTQQWNREHDPVKLHYVEQLTATWRLNRDENGVLFSPDIYWPELMTWLYKMMSEAQRAKVLPGTPPDGYTHKVWEQPKTDFAPYKRIIGTVKWFNDAKGYGVVRVKGTDHIEHELYLDRNELLTGSPDHLATIQEGQEVEIEDFFETDPKATFRYSAVGVKPAAPKANRAEKPKKKAKRQQQNRERMEEAADWDNRLR